MTVGLVSVLFANISVPASVAKVPVAVGKVIVPVLVIVLITGDVSVLFVNISVPASVARVPVVGKVRVVIAVAVNVLANAPA